MMIRTAGEGDAVAIADLWNAMIRDTLATFTTEEKSETEIAKMIAHRKNAMWVAIAGTVVKGFATYGAFRGGPGYAATVEHTIILAPEAQGQGIGQKLMDQAIATARAQGHHVMVAAISGANPAAIAFHDRLGFSQVARMPEVGRKDGKWLDLILMQKIISTP